MNRIETSIPCAPASKRCSPRLPGGCCTFGPAILLPHAAVAGFALLLVLVGCQLGPDYQPVPVEPPESWHAPTLTDSQRLQPGESPDLTWWELLGDPELVVLIERAVAANPDLAAAAARLRRSRHLVGVAEARLLPRLSAGARFDRVSFSENLPVLDRFFASGQVATEQELASATFDAAWELDLFGGARRQAEVAAARAGAAAAARRDVLLTLVAEVANNYFALRRAQAEARSLENSIALQGERVVLSKARLDAGVGARPAVAQALARHQALTARLPPLRAREAAAAYRLAVLTAQEPAAVYRAHAEPRSLPGPPDLVPVGLPGEMLRRRPDVRRAEQQLVAATAAIGVNVARLFPRVSLTGLAGFQAQSFTDLARSENETWALSPGVGWEIFRGGALRAELAASRAARDGRLAAYRATVNVALAEAEGALARYASAFEARERLSAALAHGDRAVALAQSGFDAGVASQDRVLLAKLRREETRRELVGARGEVLVALAALNKALGGGWPTE